MADRDGKTTRGPLGGSPAEAERALKSEAAIRGMPPDVRRSALADLAAARQRLGQTVCSQAWFDDCWATGLAFPPPADTSPMLPCRCERCRRQGRVWPAQYGSPDHLPASIATFAIPASREVATHSSAPSPGAAFIAYDCYLESLDDWTAAQLPSSPSGLALRAIREGRIRLRRQRTRLGRRQRTTGA